MNIKKLLIGSAFGLCASSAWAYDYTCQNCAYENGKYVCESCASNNPENEVLSIFNLPLKDANREKVRQVLKEYQFKFVSESNQKFCDEYEVNGQIPEANKLKVCYADIEGTDTFAVALYTFGKTFDYVSLNDVFALVKGKYGQPSYSNNKFTLGIFTAKWELNKDEMVELDRGWPPTIVQLYLVNKQNELLMKQQIEDAKIKQQQKSLQESYDAF